MPLAKPIKDIRAFQKKFFKQLKEGDITFAIFNSMPDTRIFVKDGDLRYIVANTPHIKSKGLEKEEDIIGLKDVDIMPAEWAEMYNADDREVLSTGKPIINRHEIIKEEGGKKNWHSTTKIPLFDPEGKVVGLAGITRNINQQQKLLKKVENQKKKLELLNQIDPLTGVYNRRFFQMEIPKYLKVYQRENSAYSIVIFDIDHFKAINDTYGHAAGDFTLVRFCEVVQTVLKRNADFFIRYGGDEFIGCLFGSDERAALFVANAIRNKIKEASWPRKLFPRKTMVTVSVGVASTDNMELPKVMFKRADAALYQAKRKGRNRIEVK